MVYSVIKNYEGSFYILDCKTGKSEEISLHMADGYKKIVPADQKNIFYYEDWEVSPDGEKSVRSGVMILKRTRKKYC